MILSNTCSKWFGMGTCTLHLFAVWWVLLCILQKLHHAIKLLHDRLEISNFVVLLHAHGVCMTGSAAVCLLESAGGTAGLGQTHAYTNGWRSMQRASII